MQQRQDQQFFPLAQAPHDKARPENPLAAVTHPDPYPYYAALVDGNPIYRDTALDLWISSGAAAVEAVLTSENCRVRPAAEPVPKAIAGSAAGSIFRLLVRMNEGPVHRALKQGVSAALNEENIAQVIELARRWSRLLCESLEPARTAPGLNDFILQLPVAVMADLLGIPEEKLQPVTTSVADLVAGFSPLATPGDIEKGNVAASSLIEATVSALEQPNTGHSLVWALHRHSVAAGQDSRDAIVANAIGFLTQAYEATAGLIGNTLLTLSSNPSAYAEIVARPSLLDDVIAEVIRWDPPVHNTRRYVSAPGIVAGKEMQQDDAILVILAAANRDPARNPEPHLFDIQRESRKSYTFGSASHACPGEAYATAIAAAAVSCLLSAGLHPGTASWQIRYRRSLNTRVPVFSSPAITTTLIHT